MTPIIPRTLRIAAAATCLAAVLAACGSSDGNDAANSTAPSESTTAGTGTTGGSTETTAGTETTDAGATPTPDALTVESGFASGLSSLGTRYTSAGAVVTNTAGQSACGVTVEFSLSDAAGTVLDTREETIAAVPAGAAVPVSPSALGGDVTVEPATLEVTVVSVDSFAADACETTSAVAQGLVLTTADVTVEDLKYIRGTVSNPTETAADSASVDCILRDAGGAIVGGGKTVVREAIAAGASTAFKVRLVWAPEQAATAECTASA